MSVQPQTTRVATSWPGEFILDEIIAPLQGIADVPQDQILGTLEQDVISAVYATGLLTFTFQPQTLQAGVTVIPSLEIGTATPIVDVAVESISTTTQTIGIRFRSAVGGAGTPPSAATGAKLHLAIFRPLPVR